MARRGYSDELKAACAAALAAGQGIAEIAAQYNVPKPTLRSWKARLGLNGGAAAPLVSEDARGKIGELVLGYLADLIGALRKQVVVFGDVDWLKKQSAGELAVLHGVCVDKTIRLLEALEQPDADADSEAGVEPVPEVAGALPGAVGPGL